MLSHEKLHEHSRLGRLLVNRGYITEAQLESALREQTRTGMRLGELLVKQGLLSERILERTLKHQSRYRYAAALMAIAVVPFQPQIALAGTLTGSGVQPVRTAAAVESGLQPLSESQMEMVSARGITDDFQVLYSLTNDDGNVDSIKALWSLTRTLFPIWQVLDADISIQGVYYDASRAALKIVEGGGFNLPLPNLIEEVRIENIRVSGTVGPSFGSLIMEGIRFNDNASIVVKPN